MRLLEANSTTGAAQNFTGLWESISGDTAIRFMHNTSVGGTVTIQFSMDAITVDRQFTYVVYADNPDTHSRSVHSRYFRLVWAGDSSPVTVRISVFAGTFTLGTRPLNEATTQDTDVYSVVAFDSATAIAASLVNGYEVYLKNGRNPDIDTGDIPEDVWNGGGVYTGFPLTSPEEIQVFSSDVGDTGTLVFTYLASSSSTEWQSATVTLQGTTQVNTGVTAYRMHTARYSSGSATAFNIGSITIRHRTTTTNVFAVMPAGRGQTYVSAFTVPQGCTGVIKRLFCRVFSNVTASVEGALWVRSRNQSPRLRRPFTAKDTTFFEESSYGGIQLQAGDDIVIRITAATASNLDVTAGYDLVCIKN